MLRHLLFWCFSLALCSATFERSHLRLVDHNATTNNFVFRGGSVVEAIFHGFAWKSLNKAMSELAEAHGLSLPEKYVVIDICLLTHEVSTIQMERRYFEKNPSRGSFEWWPMWGLNETTLNSACLTSTNTTSCAANPSMQPGVYSADTVKSIASQFAQNGLEAADELQARVARINRVLNTAGPLPTIQYFHCTCGCDRTGELGAAYNMRFKGYNFTRAMKYDVSIPKRNIGYSHQTMAEWYCEALVASGAYVQQYNDCSNCEPFRCSNKKKTVSR